MDPSPIITAAPSISPTPDERSPSHIEQTCFNIVFSHTNAFRVPVFNVVLAIFPIFFLMLLMWKMDAIMRMARPHIMKRKFNYQAAAMVRDGPERIAQEDGYGGYSLQHTQFSSWYSRVFGRLVNYWRRRVLGLMLPQYFTLIRAVIGLDFFFVVLILIASQPNETWFKVLSLLTRIGYRFLELSVAVVLLSPLVRSKQNPRYIGFEWRVPLFIAGPVSILPIIGQLGVLIFCGDFIPEVSLILSVPEAQMTVYESTSQCHSKHLWLAFDAFDLLLFCVLTAIPLVYSTTEDGTPQRVELIERETEDNIYVLYPRRALVQYGIFLVITWLFRVGACLAVIFDTNNWGGPYLCLFAISYFMEHAMLPFAMHYVLVADSEFLHGNSWASNAGEFIRWINYARGGKKKGSLGGIEYTEAAGHTFAPNNSFGDALANTGMPFHASSDFDALQINPADIVVFPQPLSPPHCQYKVYRGAWLGAPVAVKIIPLDEGSVGEETRMAILSEVRILRRLSHPNVVHFLGWCEETRRTIGMGGRGRSGTNTSNVSRNRAGTEDGVAGAGIADPFASTGDYEVIEGESHRELWIVMELLPLTSVEKLNKDAQTVFTYRQLVRMFTHVCRGMAFLENKQVIHRDLKSPNVFVGRGFVLKIGDFGESTIMGTQSEADTGKLLGSYEWAAPEVIARREYSHKSDMYAFGMVMWELVSRRMPFDHIDATDMFDYQDAVMRDIGVGYRHTIPDDCPFELNQLISQCWAENPADRPTFDMARKRLEDLKRKLKLDLSMWSWNEREFSERQHPKERRVSVGSITVTVTANDTDESPHAPLLVPSASSSGMGGSSSSLHRGPRRVKSEHRSNPSASAAAAAHVPVDASKRAGYGTWSGPAPASLARELRSVVATGDVTPVSSPQ